MNSLLPQPTAAECRALRDSLGLTVQEMATVAGLAHRQRWAEYESEAMDALPDRYRWTLLMLTLDLHPDYVLLEKLHYLQMVRRHFYLKMRHDLTQAVAQEQEKEAKP
jgi:transcriptional regulator with XRE-family HTH domain